MSDAQLYMHLCAQLAQRFGLDSASLGEAVMLDALSTRRLALGLPSQVAYLRHALSDARECDALGQALLVNETWFDRDSNQLDVLQMLLRTGTLRAPTTVWSAPCASGEECYSIAARFVAAGWGPSAIKVIGLDLAGAALSKAQARRYPRSAWRGTKPVPSWLEPAVDGSLTVVAAVAECVSFQRGNLIHEQTLAGLPTPQLVFSRNFFIYLTANARKHWLSLVVARATAETLLFTGPGESVSAWDSRFAVSDVHPYVFKLRAGRVADQEELQLRLPAARSLDESTRPPWPRRSREVSGS